MEQSSQKARRMGHPQVFGERRNEQHRQECLCHKKPQEGRASPAPTRLREVTVECGDYGYYTDWVGD